MRKLINHCFRWYYQQRYLKIQRIVERPHETQRALLLQLIRAAEQTEWGLQFGYRHLKTPEAYARSVHEQDYESLTPYIQRMMYDAGKYRLMLKARDAATAKPVPPVQRPGMARTAAEREQADLRTLNARLSSSGDLRDAVALYHARKSGRR